MVCVVARWVLDRDQDPVREGAIQRGAVAEYLALSKPRRERVKHRAILVAVVAAVTVTGVSIVVRLSASWVIAVCGVSVIFLGGVVGTPPDQRILDAATLSGFAPPRLTSDSVTRALRSLGISGITAEDAEMTYSAPITRDGPGWRADVPRNRVADAGRSRAFTISVASSATVRLLRLLTVRSSSRAASWSSS